jgi:hypothetical protein
LAEQDFLTTGFYDQPQRQRSAHARRP